MSPEILAIVGISLMVVSFIAIITYILVLADQHPPRSMFNDAYVKAYKSLKDWENYNSGK